MPEENRLNPYVITFCVSLLLSYLAVSTDNLLNHDAIYFMTAAKIYLRNNFAALIQYFSWPFYSWLVAVIHQISFFPHIEQTAHFINAFFIAGTCILFIKIYAEVTNNEKSLWIAAVLVLTLVGVNKYRADVMKDFGYWFFYLAGFYCLIRYYKKSSLILALGWQVFTMLAFLFRIEGVVIMLLGPLVMFFKRESLKERVIQAIPLYGIYIFGLVLLVIFLLITDYAHDLVSLSRLRELSSYLNGDNHISSLAYRVYMLGRVYEYEGDHLGSNIGVLTIIYLVSLAAYVVVKIVNCMGVAYFAVVIAGIWKRHVVLSDINRIIIYFAGFLFVFFFIYSVKAPVLSSRYTTSLVFMLLLLLGQIVERFFPGLSKSRHRNQIVAAAFIYLFISTIDSVISTQGDSKTYVLNAGYWVKENTEATVPVYSNYYKALYYTDREFNLQNRGGFNKLIRDVRLGKIASGDILMLQVKSKDIKKRMLLIGKIEAADKIIFLKKFMNSENDGIVIYEVK